MEDPGDRRGPGARCVRLAALGVAFALLGAPALAQQTGKPKPPTAATAKKPAQPQKAEPLPPPARKVPADAPTRFPTDI